LQKRFNIFHCRRVDETVLVRGSIWNSRNKKHVA
jgi:hypothetical protein